MTPNQLAQAVGIPIARAAKWADILTEAMKQFDIDTPARQAAFIAQIAHESARFAYTKELWGPTPAQTRYEGRKDLGNTQPGDGKRYMGRGLIQITGRANYEDVGKALGMNFIKYPEMLELPMFAAKSAAWWWKSHGLNEMADGNKFKLITRTINGRFNGLDDRLALWDRCKKELA